MRQQASSWTGALLAYAGLFQAGVRGMRVRDPGDSIASTAWAADNTIFSDYRGSPAAFSVSPDINVSMAGTLI